MKVVQTTQPFTDPQNNAVASGKLVLQLPQDCTVTSGGGQIAPLEVVLSLTAAGKLSGTDQIYANDELTPSGTAYTVYVLNSNGLVVYGPEKWEITGASPIDLSQMTPSTSSVSFPSAVLQVPGAAQSITGFSLTLDKTAPLIAARVNNVRYPNEYAGANGGAKLAAALTDIQSDGGGIVDATGLLGAQTITQNIFSGVTVPGILRLNPSAVYTTNFTQLIPSYWLIETWGGGRSTGSVTSSNGATFKWNGVAFSSVNISSIARAANVVTVQTSTAHGLTAGNIVNIAGVVTQTTFNGNFLVATVADTTHFTFAQVGSAVSDTTGTAQGQQFPLAVYNAHNVTLRGFNIDCGSVSGANGLLYDGVNNPAGNNCVFDSLNFCNTVAGVGLQWGSSSVNDYQLDTTRIINCQFIGDSTSTGIDINSGNAGQASCIENCTFQTMNIGVNIHEWGGLFSITRCVAGALAGTNPIVFKLGGSGSGQTVSDGLIKECQSEGGGAGINFIKITGNSGNAGSITLINNKFDEPVVVDRNVRILSMGNFGPSTATATGNASVVSIGDRFNSFAGWTMTSGAALRLGGGDSGADAPNVIAAQPTGTPVTIKGLLSPTTLSRTRIMNTFSATPTFDASTGDIQQINLTGNVTSSTVTNPTDGQTLRFIIIENAPGGFTFAWPANFKGATAITTTNGITNTQSFTYNSTSTSWNADSTGIAY